MARMLGRNRQGCTVGHCRHCRTGDETRIFKRREKERFRRDLAPEADLEWLASLEPALYDLSDCRHGCNGWPCGSELCTFVCHEGWPVQTYWDGGYQTVTQRD